MKKILLYTHISARADVFDVLQSMGAVEFSELGAAEIAHLVRQEKESFEFDYVVSRLDSGIEFISRFADQKGGLRPLIEGKRLRAHRGDLHAARDVPRMLPILDRIEELRAKLRAVDVSMKRLIEEKQALEGWNDICVPLSLMRTANTRTVGVIAAKEKKQEWAGLFLKELGDGDAAVLHALRRIGRGRYVITYARSVEDAVEGAIKRSFGDSVTFDGYRGTVAEERAAINTQLRDAGRATSAVLDAAREIIGYLPELRMASDALRLEKAKYDAMHGSFRTSDVAVFRGWCRADTVSDLRSALSARTAYAELMACDPDPDDDAPVAIENAPLIRPFEAVTRLYGLPSYRDLDPTIFLSGFFFIFFGLCLTDVGYGALLLVIASVLLWRYRVLPEIAVFLKLLMFGGAATIVVGMLFGGYFGIDGSYLPAWLRSIQYFDPIRTPMTVLGLSLGLGVAQILFGLFLHIVAQAKRGALRDGIYDRGPWILVFGSLIGWGVSAFAGAGGIPSSVYLWGVYAGSAGIVLAQGRHEKNIAMKIFKGVLGLYDVVGFFSDILSYSRLLALGLATSAIAFAVNMIALMIRDMVPIPVIGTVLMVVVLVVGHLFNLMVNTLGACIHSARLQFVEFFTKFMSGAGREFRPFSEETQYILLQDRHYH